MLNILKKLNYLFENFKYSFVSPVKVKQILYKYENDKIFTARN